MLQTGNLPNAEYRRFEGMREYEALIDGLIGSGMDITQHGSEATLRALVARRLGRDA